MEYVAETNRIRIVEVVPNQVHGKRCLCIAFEPVDEHLGDQVHLAFVFSPFFDFEADSIWEMLQAHRFQQPMPLRIHSECLLGDALQTQDCDCSSQLKSALQQLSDQNNGMLIYLRQEGRGIGLREKLRCLALQKGYMRGDKIGQTFSSDEANLFFGFKKDERDYAIAANLLPVLHVEHVWIATGNPHKIRNLREHGIVAERIGFQTALAHRSLSKKARLELEEKMRRGYEYDLK